MANRANKNGLRKPALRGLSSRVDFANVLNDHLANATGPHHRRRPRRLAKPPGRSRAAACRWCCTRCGPVRTTAAHKTEALAELVCSNSFRSDDRETNAVGLLHEEMRRLGSLIMRCGDANQVPAGGALAVDRDGFSAAVTAALEAHPLIEIRREEIAAAAGRLGQRHRRDRPPHLARARRRHPRADRRRLARLLRRDRADRASQLDRHVGRLVPVALRQGRPRRLRRRLHQLPADARAIRRLRRCAARRRQDLVPRMGSDHALFRRLPADRGDGRARAARRCATGR